MNDGAAGEESGEGLVAWEESSIELELSRGMAVDMALWYTVDLGGLDEGYTLTLRRCEDLAGPGGERCESGAEEVREGEIPEPWGLDPSQYRVGVNVYTFTLILRRGEVVSTSTLEVAATVSS